MTKNFSINPLTLLFLFTPLLIPFACNKADSPTDPPSNSLAATSTPSSTATATPTTTLTPCGSPLIFGKTTVGSYDSTGYDQIFGNSYTLATTGTVYNLSADFAAGAGVQAAMGIYSGSLSSPANLVVQSAAKTCVAGWNDFSVTSTPLSAGTYWVCLFVGPYPGVPGSVLETSGASSNHHGYLGLTGFGGGIGTFPSVAAGWTTSTGYVWDMYATYCP